MLTFNVVGMKLMSELFHIRSSKFPILPNEADELVNPGTYGKCFAEYLQHQLREKGYDCPFVCCEDWGWWVEVRLQDLKLGITCYREHDENRESGFVCGLSREPGKVWNWRRLRFLDATESLQSLRSDLRRILRDDPEITWIGAIDDFPF